MWESKLRTTRHRPRQVPTKTNCLGWNKEWSACDERICVGEKNLRSTWVDDENETIHVLVHTYEKSRKQWHRTETVLISGASLTSVSKIQNCGLPLLTLKLNVRRQLYVIESTTTKDTLYKGRGKKKEHCRQRTFIILHGSRCIRVTSNIRCGNVGSGTFADLLLKVKQTYTSNECQIDSTGSKFTAQRFMGFIEVRATTFSALVCIAKELNAEQLSITGIW